MKKLLSSLALLLSVIFSLFLTVPTSALSSILEKDWDYTIDSAGFKSLFSTIKHSNGSYYLGGDYSDTIDFDPGTGTAIHANQGSGDGYLTKLTADGVHVWTKVWGGIGYDRALRVVELSDGSLAVLGFMSNTVDLDPGVGTVSETVTGVTDVYISIFDQDGIYQDSMRIGGTGSELVFDIFQHTDNSIVIAGGFSGTMDFDPGASTTNHTSVGDHDIFIASYNTDLDYEWSHTFGSTEFDSSGSLAQNSSGEILLGGTIAGSADFDTDSPAGSWVGLGGNDAYITKYEADGTYLETFNVGATGNQKFSALTIAEDDSLVLTGNFCAAFDVDPSAGVTTLTHEGGCDGMVVYLEPDGSLRWAKTIAGSVDLEEVPTLTIGPDGFVYANGESYSTNFHFEGESDIYDSEGWGHVFLGKYDPANGDLIYGRAWGYNPDGPGSMNSTYGKTLIIGTDDSIYLAATIFGDEAYMDPDETVTRTVTGSGLTFMRISQTTRHHLTLPFGLSVTELDSGDNAAAGEEGIVSDPSTILRLSQAFDSLILADVVVDMTSDHDWSDITFGTDPETGKSFVHGLSDAPGAASTFTLYTPKLDGDNAVGICPGADALADLNPDCPNLSIRKSSHDSISSTTIDDLAYWKITGLTGTGAFSTATLAETGMDSNFLSKLALTIVASGGVLFVVRRRYV